MKKVLLTALLLLSMPTLAFVPIVSLTNDTLISESFLVFIDKNGNEWKAETTCNKIDLEENMQVTTSSRTRTLSKAKLVIRGKNQTQVCRITQVSSI